MKKKRRAAILLALLLTAGMCACGGGGTAPAPTAAPSPAETPADVPVPIPTAAPAPVATPEETEAPAASLPPDDGAAASPVGRWIGLYTRFTGDPDDVRDESDDFYLELNPDGSGVHHRNDLDFLVRWTQEGETVTLRETFLGAALDYVGSLTRDELRLYNGDPDDGLTCEYVYQRG